eukprot:scaffold7755_cov104-Cylindrotheca_fusiformis.AAC.5
MNDDYLEGEISSLTDDQEIILSVLMISSAVLSAVGSLTIVYKVISKNRQRKPYDRIMLGLSICDIVASLAYIMTPFLLPKQTSQRVWASGSKVSCSILGWLTQFSLAGVVYNALLSFYFLLTLKYSVTADDFAARFEPYWHSLTIFFFLFTATMGVPFHIFSELEIGQGCWIGEFPEGCEARGDCIGNQIGWVFGGLPVLFTFVSLPVNNLLVFFHVKNLLRTGHSHMAAQQGHVRRVAVQGFLYVACFLVSYTPTAVIRIFESLGFDASQESSIFVLLAFNSLLLPLQGFFNVFVYTRPNYLRLRRAGLPCALALRGALFETDIPRFITQARVVPSTADRSQRQRLLRTKEKTPPVLDSSKQVPDSLLDLPEFELFSAEISAEVTTDEDRDSSDDAQAPVVKEPKRLVSCLKSSPKRVQMDGTISLMKH